VQYVTIEYFSYLHMLKLALFLFSEFLDFQTAKLIDKWIITERTET
jgi:hypothetical protein